MAMAGGVFNLEHLAQEGCWWRRHGARSAPPLRHSAHQKRKKFGGRGAMEASRN